MFETLIMVASIAANIVLAAALFQAKRDYDSLQDDCLSLETDNEDLRGRNEDATREIRRLKELADAYHETNQSLAAKVGDLEADNAQVIKISNDQFAKVQNQQAIIDELTSENDKLRNVNHRLQIQLDAKVPIESMVSVQSAITEHPLPDEAREVKPDRNWWAPQIYGIHSIRKWFSK